MNHKQIKELLPLYLDNGLEKDELEIIKKHLTECKECRQKLAAYRLNQQLLSSLNETTAPEEFLPGLIAKLNRTERDRHGKDSSAGWLNRLKRYFIFPLKIPAGALAVSAVIIIVILASLSGNFAQQDYISSPQTEYRQDFSLNRNMLMKAEHKDQAAQLQASAGSKVQIDQKIIKEASIRIEVKDITKVYQQIIAITEKYGGYIANSSNWQDDNQNKYSNYYLKIPADQFTTVLDLLTGEEIGNLLYRSISGQDVSEEYYDLEIRLKNLTLQEERYRELLVQATTVEDILKIEKELERIRTEIERLEGRLNYLDDRVNLSSISVEFQEIKPLGSGNWGMVRALRQAIQALSQSIYRLIVGLGTILPYLLILAILYLVWKRRK